LGVCLAFVLAQFLLSSGGATGSSLAVIGLLYIIRAGTDVSNDSLSMINPLGWTYLTYPFTDNNWMPIMFALVFIIVFTIMAFTLEGARDMGAGYLPPQEGRERARKSAFSVRG